MTRRVPSAATAAIARALLLGGMQWQHGYALARTTGLASGTLYPVLIRLHGRGLLEASWEEEAPQGRPRRHLYRLTARGHFWAESVATEQAPSTDSASAPKGVRGAEA